jgi:hypothetical protein
MTRAEADREITERLDRILDLLSNPNPELQAAIERSNRKTPDYDAVCQRVLERMREGL